MSKVNPELFIEGKSVIDDVKTSLVNGLRLHKVLLNEEHKKIDYIPGLKTTLFNHQKTIVCAMHELETKRKLSLINLDYNAAVLSDPVGSGKTIDILSIICLQKKPRAVPEIRKLNELVMVKTKYKKFLTPTVIFVGSSVMSQWELAIKRFTELSYYTVRNLVDLRELLQMAKSRQINKFDIVLIKNGTVSRTVEMPDKELVLDDRNHKSTPSIYNIVANLYTYCWARVVIDDFDTIRLPRDAGIVNGLFTWYISSTKKYMNGLKRKPFIDTKHALLHNQYGCADILDNTILFRNLNICNNPSYLKFTTKIPYPKYHVASFKNPNNLYMSVMASMGNAEINRITEMLNGDAIGTAAETAGIKSTSVADIFSKILGDKFLLYKKASTVLDFIEYQEDKKAERKSIKDNPDPEDTYGKKDLLDYREIEYKYPNVPALIRDCTEEFTNVKHTNGLEIERVKENLRHGECPVCSCDLEDADAIIIMKCCNAVFCDDCGIKAQNFQNRAQRLQNRCANCRQQVSIKDLIYIGEEVELEDIDEEIIDDISDEESVSDESINETITKEPNNKYEAIIHVIQGKAFSADRRVDLHIPNMMKGSCSLPEAQIRKVLIFANFDETLDKVIVELKKHNIKYWKLGGRTEQIAKLAEQFTLCQETCALVINSTKHCSGLNLQTATDLIFAHKITDQSVESQVSGRGHRLGRTSPLNIWYMVYDNEYQHMMRSNNVRELSKEEIAYADKQ